MDTIESISDSIRVETESEKNKIKIAKLLELNQKGLSLYQSGLYQGATAVFLEVFQLIPNNLQLALNLAQSITKGWPTTEPYSVKKLTIKRCINIIESQAIPLEKQVKARYESFEYELKRLIIKMS